MCEAGICMSTLVPCDMSNLHPLDAAMCIQCTEKQHNSTKSWAHPFSLLYWAPSIHIFITHHMSCFLSLKLTLYPAPPLDTATYADKPIHLWHDTALSLPSIIHTLLNKIIDILTFIMYISHYPNTIYDSDNQLKFIKKINK